MPAHCISNRIEGASCQPVRRAPVSTGGRYPDAAYWRQLSAHCLLEALAAPTLTRTQFWNTGFERCEAALAMIATTEKFNITPNSV